MVLVIAIIYTFIFIVGFSVNATKRDYKRKNDKLVLNPIDLIDILIEERKESTSRSLHKNHIISYTKLPRHDKLDYKWAGGYFRVFYWYGNAKYNYVDNKPYVCIKDDILDDAEILKTRKIWSRWSKWSDCSVTCGEGSIVRRRCCVAGRCAHHEREEQRRPCARPPCAKHITDDLHDMD